MTVPAQPAAPSAPYAPPVRYVKPPLTARAKRGATIAGIVGFLMLTAGWTLGVLTLAVAVIALVGMTILSQITDADISGADSFKQMFEGLNASAFVLPLILVAIFGLLLMVGGLFVSAGILKSHGVTRPWAVTWAGFGIAVVASWVATGILNLIISVISALFQDSSNTFDTAFWVGAGATVILSIVVNAVIGWLAWWWMAHALRPAAAPPAAAYGLMPEATVSPEA